MLIYSIFHLRLLFLTSFHILVLPLPFIGSGLISTFQQVQSVLRAGALRVATARSELYM